MDVILSGSIAFGKKLKPPWSPDTTIKTGRHQKSLMSMKKNKRL